MGRHYNQFDLDDRIERRCQSKRVEAVGKIPQPLAMRNPFRYFNSSPEVIRLAAMMYIRYPLSLRQVEDLLFERGMVPSV